MKEHVLVHAQPSRRTSVLRNDIGETAVSAQKQSGTGMKRIKGQNEIWDLALFVRGKEPESLLAFQALTRLCDRHLRGRCTIDIVDVELHPQLAQREGIEQTPTLLKRGPPPRIKLSEDLRETGQMAAGLGLIASASEG